MLNYSYFSANELIPKALSHGAIFLATCSTILLLRDVKLSQMSGMLKIYQQTLMETCTCQFDSSEE